MNARILRLRSRLRRIGLDAILISHPANIYYISGFMGLDSYCLVAASRNFIITDFRYQAQAEKEAPGFEVVYKHPSLFKKTIQAVKNASLKRVGFESHHLTFKEAEVINSGIKTARLVPTFYLIENMRAVKDSLEIGIIKKAAAITKDTLKKAVKSIKKGDSEKEIASEIDYLLRRKGADGSAFDTIVASGANAAMPHAKPTDKKVRKAEPIIIDCGVRLKGYNSDLTRTRFVDKIDARSQLIYSIVAAAQRLAISKVKPGAKASEIDAAARGYISKKGFGEYFGHSTGHGIGLEVHELPSISPKNHNILREGMVFSIEPAIYLPGWGGIRIEDMIAVTRKGAVVLTG